MYPNSMYFGLKVLPKKVRWAQSIYYLSTWILRVGFGVWGLGQWDLGLGI